MADTVAFVLIFVVLSIFECTLKQERDRQFSFLISLPTLLLKLSSFTVYSCDIQASALVCFESSPVFSTTSTNLDITNFKELTPELILYCSNEPKFSSVLALIAIFSCKRSRI